MDKKRIGVGCLLQLGAGWHGKNQKVWKPDRFQFRSRSRSLLVPVAKLGSALQVLVLVPKGRRIVAEVERVTAVTRGTRGKQKK